jgi:cation diffusion facilitator family transporter
MKKEKIEVARLSILSNLTLVILKLSIGLLTGAVSILSEAIHSAMDLLASFIAFFSVKISGNPPDRNHPYGHGRFENLSGILEAALIFVASAWIIYEAVEKILHPTEVESIGLGSLVMFISATINFFVSKKLYKVARATDSLALEADALHLRTDVITSLGVAIGLLLMWITDIKLLDPIVAIIVALYILRESYRLFVKSLMPMMDQRWSERELTELCEILDRMHVTYHDLRTRKSGNFKFTDFHMSVPSDETIRNIHDFCDRIEAELHNHFSDLTVNIHVEPDDVQPVS